MKLIQLYEHVVACGKACDPRAKERIFRFEDSAILYGDPGKVEVKRILAGIDIDAGELLLADRLRAKESIDLVIAHHPQGRAWAAFYEVMQLQVDLLTRAGVDPSLAKELISMRKEEVARRVHAGNHMRAVTIAEALDMPFMCAHTPADNHAALFIDRLFKAKKPVIVDDIMDILMGEPEYQEAAGNLAGPRIILGSGKRSVGKIFIEMTGGTEGPKEAYDSLYRHGVRTLVSMHLSEEHIKKIKDVQLNVILAGHISSDTLGMNVLFDAVEKRAREHLEFVGCSGFRRIRRN